MYCDVIHSQRPIKPALRTTAADHKRSNQDLVEAAERERSKQMALQVRSIQ